MQTRERKTPAARLASAIQWAGGLRLKLYSIAFSLWLYAIAFATLAVLMAVAAWWTR